VARLYDLVRPRDEALRPAFFYAFGDTLVAGDLEQAARIAYGADRRWSRVVTLQARPRPRRAPGAGRPARTLLTRLRRCAEAFQAHTCVTGCARIASDVWCPGEACMHPLHALFADRGHAGAGMGARPKDACMRMRSLTTFCLSATSACLTMCAPSRCSSSMQGEMINESGTMTGGGGKPRGGRMCLGSAAPRPLDTREVAAALAAAEQELTAGTQVLAARSVSRCAAAPAAR